MTVANEKSGCLSVIVPFLKLLQKGTKSKAMPYRLRDDFLSPAEFSFYKVLLSLVDARLTIQSKVRLADVFFVARRKERGVFFNRISQKHLDFLVCDSVTMKPIFGIELDDSSHKRNDRRGRDEFIENVCQSAGLPLLRVPVQLAYNSREIAAQVAPFLKDKISAPVVIASQPENNKQLSSVPLCPKCGVPMVLRTVAQGKYKGNQFYGCQNYPHCRENKPVST